MEGEQASLDRISTIPPNIIESILCLVPIQDAARTCILSKEWRYTWTKISKLFFGLYPRIIPNRVSIDDNPLLILEETFAVPSERIFMSRRFKLFSAIFQVLLVHQGPILDFTLSVDADETCVEIDQIISYLSRKNTVKKLTLKLSLEYKLPLSLFSLHQLTDLSLVYCEIDHEPSFNGFANLTSLHMDHVNINKQTLLHLVSSCPLLKSFHLIMVERNALGIDMPTITDLLECLRVIEHVTFSNRVIECFADIYIPQKGPIIAHLPQELPTSLVHLKYFCLEDMCHVDICGLPFIVYLIRSSPNLEKLELQYQYIYPERFSRDKIRTVAPQDYSGIQLEHLKELVIDHFAYLKHEMEFVKFILAKSPMLLKVSIVLDRVVTKDEKLQMLGILSRSPHASPLVLISTKYVTYSNIGCSKGEDKDSCTDLYKVADLLIVE